jgi:hypothetical protein
LLSGSLEGRVSFGGSCSAKGLSWTASRASSCLLSTLFVLLVLSSKLFVLLVVEALSCFFMLLVAEVLLVVEALSCFFVLLVAEALSCSLCCLSLRLVSRATAL